MTSDYKAASERSDEAERGLVPAIRHTAKATAHTPGPWTVIRNTNSAGIYRQGAHKVKDHIAATPEGFAGTAPNARLIAAAPELLQTIKDIQHNAQVMNQAEPNRVWTAIDDSCRAAIAKAEGK